MNAELVALLERERLTGMPRWNAKPPVPVDDERVCAERRRTLTGDPQRGAA